jgi:hypothetical protein
MRDMLYKIGRFLQFVGLVLLPVGIAGNLARPDEFGLWYTLGISAAGMAVFTLGWLLQQAVRKE